MFSLLLLNLIVVKCSISYLEVGNYIIIYYKIISNNSIFIIGICQYCIIFVVVNIDTIICKIRIYEK